MGAKNYTLIEEAGPGSEIDSYVDGCPMMIAQKEEEMKEDDPVITDPDVDILESELADDGSVKTGAVALSAILGALTLWASTM